MPLDHMTQRIVESLPNQEKSLIDRIRRSARRRSGVATGIGEDCAVLSVPPGHQQLVTTDFTLENVHFRREWHSPEVVGWRCLTRGLSDIAAMGGEPRAAFLSLALDRDTPQKWVDEFLAGLLKATDEFRVSLAGGDTAQSDGGIQADIVLVGSVPKGKAILRSGARPGDLIYVTGELGGSAAAIERLIEVGKMSAPVETGEDYDFSRAERATKVTAASAAEKAPSGHRAHPQWLKPDSEQASYRSGEPLRHPKSSATPNFSAASSAAGVRAQDYPRHFHPTARVQIGQWLRRRDLASAMIDISDGLSTDLQHICDESGVGVVIEASAIPRANVGRPTKPVSIELSLHGGEDYELLFTSAKKIPARIAGVPVTPIGQIRRPRGMLLVDQNGRRAKLAARGWEHFQTNS